METETLVNYEDAAADVADLPETTQAAEPAPRVTPPQDPTFLTSPSFTLSKKAEEFRVLMNEKWAKCVDRRRAVKTEIDRINVMPIETRGAKEIAEMRKARMQMFEVQKAEIDVLRVVGEPWPTAFIRDRQDAYAAANSAYTTLLAEHEKALLGLRFTDEVPEGQPCIPMRIYASTHPDVREARALVQAMESGLMSGAPQKQDYDRAVADLELEASRTFNAAAM
jgi:hypothetical protein